MTCPASVPPLPMGAAHVRTAGETLEHYGLAEEPAAWEELRRRALDTSRPFRAYDAAHAIGAAIAGALGDYPPDSIGGRAILRGWHAQAAGLDRPAHVWPYLATRGWIRAANWGKQYGE